MSVINKMLRDLDHRQAVRTPSHQGTASIVRASGAIAPPSRRWVWIGLTGLVVALLAGGWLWNQPSPDATRLDTAVAPTPAAAPMLAVATPEAAATQAVAHAALNPVPGAMVLRMEESLSARRALDALLSKPAPSGPATAPERSKASAAVAVPVAATPPAASAARVSAATAQLEMAPVAQRQQLAGADALAQAQSLWNAGSHDAAMDLMQQSIAAAERAAKAGSGASAASMLPALVREMARMQLAEGRFGAMWEMLTRLEPQLGNQPDLWAIRANAAQRLGRHQDSVHAYMVALQSRPDEQRWLLGAAVSLAALGQTSSAAEMAEKARAVGPVSKDILAYLRQTGVPLKDQ